LEIHKSKIVCNAEKENNSKYFDKTHKLTVEGELGQFPRPELRNYQAPSFH